MTETQGGDPEERPAKPVPEVPPDDGELPGEDAVGEDDLLPPEQAAEDETVDDGEDDT